MEVKSVYTTTGSPRAGVGIAVAFWLRPWETPMRRFAACSSAVALTLICANAWSGSTVPSGGAIIQIADGTTEHGCIDVSKNLVSMQLVGAQIERDQSLWDRLIHKHQALGVKFDVVITDNSGQTFDFPRAHQLGTPGQTSDIALLPMRYSIMSKYSLMGKDKQAYTNVGLDLYLVQVDTASTAFQTFKALIDFSKTLPLPSNPYEVGVGYFGDFANKIVEQNLANGASQNPDAAFSFDLAGDGVQAAACPQSGLRTGIQSVVWDYTGNMPGNFIRTADVADYCYWYDSSSGRIRYSKRPTGASQCATTYAPSAKSLDNPLVTFTISSWPTGVSHQAGQTQTVDLLQPMPSNRKFSVQEVTRFTANSSSEKSTTKVHPIVVAGLLENLARQNPNQKRVAELRAQASPQDVATAVALRRCAVVGIPADSCN